MVGIRKDTKENEEKQRLSLGFGATKPIDHTRARMVSRLAEIKVMCCMSTTAGTLNHQHPPFQGHVSLLTANKPQPYWPGFTDCARGGCVRPILSTPGPAWGKHNR